jgi:hypothetical protein
MEGRLIKVMSGRDHMACLGVLVLLGLLGCPAASGPAFAQARQNGDVSSIHAHHARPIASFSVGPDQALIYPTDLITLPDEHTTFMPAPRPGSGTASSYLVFAASSKRDGPAGTVVLETSNLKSFTYAAKYRSPVMWPPIKFMTCNPTYNTEFDESYSAPGSVVQDPTRPAGHLIMIYEAENHCPGGTWQRQFYATVGFARSTDFGKTWPAPINSEFGGKDRRPVLKMPVPEPTTIETSPIYMGNATPSAFVDTNDDGEHYIYAIYLFAGQGADGYLRVARAKLDDDDRGIDRPDRRVTFTKWYNGAFSQPGVGGLDSGVTPARGCAGGQRNGQISYNEAIDQYLLTFVCVSLQGQPGHLKPFQAAWYYSTATSLDLQNWTTPQLIQNSQFAVTAGCAFDGSGNSFDGWYPSFMSPNHAEGHLGETGQVFFMNGCDTGLKRKFMSRTFTIAIAPN